VKRRLKEKEETTTADKYFLRKVVFPLPRVFLKEKEEIPLHLGIGVIE